MRKSPLTKPLGEHELSHVMSDLLDDYAPTDEDEIRNDLMDNGWTPWIEQIMTAWSAHWAATTTCSACGAPATHLWGSLGEDGQIGSMAGPEKLAPSCDDCGSPSHETTPGTASIKANLGFDFKPRRLYIEEQMRSVKALLDDYDGNCAPDQAWLDQQMARPLVDRIDTIIQELTKLAVLATPVPSKQQLVRMLSHDDPQKLAEAVAEATRGDAGIVREAIGVSLRRFAQTVAEVTDGEIHRETFDGVLLDVLTDARSGGMA